MSRKCGRQRQPRSAAGRFQCIQGTAAGPKTANDEENFDAIRRGYDMTKHAIALASDKVKGGTLSLDFDSTLRDRGAA